MSTPHVPLDEKAPDEQVSGEQVLNVDSHGRKLSLAHRLYTGDVSWDFVGRKKLWFIISGVVIGLAVLSLLLRGLNLGIEFKGGADFSAPTQVNAQTIGTVTDAVMDTDLPEMDATTVLTIGSGEVKVQSRTLDDAEVKKVRAAIAEATGAQVDDVTYSLIGASWGEQITKKGVQALVVFLVLVSLLIWIYFRDWKMSIAALVALMHDLILTVGVYSWLGFTVTPSSLIGVLTILGYSLYDTVVVFDKVKENVADLPKQARSYSEAANHAVNQVLVRSLNTTIIGVLPVAALLFAGAFVLGSGPLKDLGLALFVGMVAGAYSSIFIATPLLAWLREREPQMKEHRANLARRAERKAQRAHHGEAVAAGAGAPVQRTTRRTQNGRNQTVRTTRSARKGK
ncbi:protein translocase subunit SecF [Luteococcus sp. Sow4_B9]|uniref:protein translocase subunit SecF n=1 Tax=Luteococcus sp. Sow4_B9 TaxID=3438792 RepID=UPI003F9DE3D7